MNIGRNRKLGHGYDVPVGNGCRVAAGRVPIGMDALEDGFGQATASRPDWPLTSGWREVRMDRPKSLISRLRHLPLQIEAARKANARR